MALALCPAGAPGTLVDRTCCPHSRKVSGAGPSPQTIWSLILGVAAPLDMPAEVKCTQMLGVA